MKSYITVLCLALFFSASSYGQQIAKEPQARGIALGFHLGERGMGSDLRYMYDSPRASWVFGLRAFGVKSSRETKIESQFQDRGSRYVYGKLNRLLVLTPYAGIQRDIVRRREGGFMQIKGSFQMGPALGILRPYYLDIFVPSPLYQQLGTPEPQPYNPSEHSYVDIVGVSSIFNSGFGKVSLRPGISMRAAALVDFAQKDSYINGLELGANLDFFFSDVEIMSKVTNPRMFLAISLGLVLGNTWTTEEIEK